MSALLTTCQQIPTIVVIWNDGNPDYIRQVQQCAIAVVILAKPLHPGTQNVNYANHAICAGIQKARELGYTHALRFRTDLLFNDIVKTYDLFAELGLEKLVFLTWFNHIRSEHPNGYLMDHVIYGPLDLLQRYRSPVNMPHDHRFTEVFLQETYFGKQKLCYEDVAAQIALIGVKKLHEYGITLRFSSPHHDANDLLTRYLGCGLCQM